MVRRVLLAWELGGGRGHAAILAWIAEALRRRGYAPTFAVQRLEALQAFREHVRDGEYFQAPIWLGLLDRKAVAIPGTVRTLGDIVGDMGACNPVVVRSMIDSWDALFHLVNPVAVIADYAPACLLAARGRVPAVVVGDGFTLPPSTLDRFVQLGSEDVAPKYDETDLTASVNEALGATGRNPIDRLPELFAADKVCAASFREFDPYAAHRTIPTVAPWVPDWNRNVPMKREEIFGYFSVHAEGLTAILSALRQVASERIPVRVHAPSLDHAARSELDAAGVIVEPKLLSFEEIQRRSRLVISLGSFGFISSALAAGIPQLVLPLGIGKNMTGKAIESLGVGRWLRLNPASPFEAVLLKQLVMEAYHDRRLTDAAIACAPSFAARLEPRPAEVVAGLVDELVAG